MLSRNVTTPLLSSALLLVAACSGRVVGNDAAVKLATAPAACTSSLRSFSTEVWTPVMEVKCYGCHHAGGIAQSMGTSFVFMDENVPGAAAHNFDVVRAAAQTNVNFLRKPSAQVAHYGGEVTPVGSADFATLTAFTAHAAEPLVENCSGVSTQALLGAAVVPTSSTALRKIAVTLGGRLPTTEEVRQVGSGSSSAQDAIVAQLLTEDAFTLRLKEWYNDGLLTNKYAVAPLGVGLFADRPTATWYEPASKWPSMDAYLRARDETNRALAGEPLNIIAYVVQHELPFTDVLTGNYTVVNPFSACALGVQTQVSFTTPVTCSPQDAAAYNPLDLQQVHVDPRQVGILSTRALMNRHTTTATNRNRHRFNTLSTVFLGSNILDLSPVRLSAGNVPLATNPVMTNNNCTVCHAVMDPGAGLMQQVDAVGQLTAAPWYTDEFAPGYFGTPLPDSAQADPLRWLGTQMAADVRFARTTVLSTYGLLTGKQVAHLPADPAAAQAAYDLLGLQGQQVDNWTQLLIDSHFNLKALVHAIVQSPLFLVDDVAPQAAAALAGGSGSPEANIVAGLVHKRVLSPEALDRKIAHVFGQPWADPNGTHYLLNDLYMYYGGIDSDTVVKRATDASGFMSNIGMRMASDMACRTVPRALSGDPGAAASALRALLLPASGAGGASPSEATVRANIVRLHWSLLGREVDPASDAVSEIYAVYQQARAQVLADGSTALAPPCQVTTALADGSALPAAAQVLRDPTGVVQAWMAAVSAMLVDFDFLYE